MASIRKKGSGFEITVSMGYDSARKKITETATFTPNPGWSEKKARAEAEKFAVRFEDKVKSGYSSAADRMTFEKFSRIFLRDMGPYLAETTLHSYRNRLELRLIPAIGQLKLSQITNHTVKAYVQMLQEDGIRKDGRSGALSASTIQIDRALISSILSYAVQEGYLALNPLIYAGKQRGKKQTAKEYHTTQFTPEQAKKFLWLLDHSVDITYQSHTTTCHGKPASVREYTRSWSLAPKWRLYFYLAIFTGARRGEMFALRWRDIDFDTNEIHIDRSIAYVPGRTIEKATKTYSSRTCVVPPLVTALARKLLAEQKRTALELGDYWKGSHGKQFADNFIFTGPDGALASINTAWLEFKKLISIYNRYVAVDEDDRLPENVTLHGLRHTTAAILIANNMDPRSVAGVLGHADPTTTLNIYSYFFQHKSTEAANVMQAALLAPETVGNERVVGK